jgi:hypothetical protein
MARSDEDKLCKAPIKVVLGGKEFDIAPLVIRDSRVWRGKVTAALGQLPRYTQVTTDDGDAFESALKKLLVEMPDMVVDLFFEYARGLDREKIEAMATDAEMAKAFEEVVAVAFPLTGSLLGVLARTTNQA